MKRSEGVSRRVCMKKFLKVFVLISFKVNSGLIVCGYTVIKGEQRNLGCAVWVLFFNIWVSDYSVSSATCTASGLHCFLSISPHVAHLFLLNIPLSGKDLLANKKVAMLCKIALIEIHENSNFQSWTVTLRRFFNLCDFFQNVSFLCCKLRSVKLQYTLHCPFKVYMFP